MKKIVFGCVGLLLMACSDDDNDCGCKDYKTSVGYYKLNECTVNSYETGWKDFVTKKEMELKQKEQGCE
ncbi:hypothetical protein [Zhouia amylolytica]|uniref:Lipoprotein n=1 Tax=Zhouia amylolytica AD3 TaxID=1286632 RepID=W2URG8_9FLAO|nr:hypothetical protein [Zhouia amylolytica]ETN95907.1 hypothetical protein P278_16290 [Zhouia amylolytica AD3]MCQ0111969.1 hypothetical protein [Zhouia amylolytica]